MKKKISISDSELKLIVVLVVMVCLATAYFFGFNKGMNNAKEIEEECVAIQSEIDSLQVMINNRVNTEKETEAYKTRMKEVIEKYPVDIPEEKALYLLQKIQNETDIEVLSLSYLGSNMKVNNGNGIAGYYDEVAIVLKADYVSYKAFMSYVSSYPDRMNIDNSNISYDTETGDISGSATIRMYYLTGTGKEYEEIPDFEIENGVSNIFGGEAITKTTLE